MRRANDLWTGIIKAHSTALIVKEDTEDNFGDQEEDNNQDKSSKTTNQDITSRQNQQVKKENLSKIFKSI